MKDKGSRTVENMEVPQNSSQSLPQFHFGISSLYLNILVAIKLRFIPEKIFEVNKFLFFFFNSMEKEHKNTEQWKNGNH